MQSSDDYVIHFFAALDCLVKTPLKLCLMAINKVDYPLDCVAHFITLGLERAQLVRARLDEYVALNAFIENRFDPVRFDK